MLKNVTIYKMSARPEGFSFEEKLQDQAFMPCQPSQEKSVGWIPPRGHEHGLLMETINGQRILKLMIETKSVPGEVLKRNVEERCLAIEASTGRKPGKKEKREISDDARMALLPMAFSKQSATLVWIDADAKLIVIDSASQSRVDEVVTALIHAWDGLALQLINTQQSPASAMAQWLVEKEAPHGFTVDRECELKACDESKAVVRYTRHALDTSEISDHIAAGKMPTKLALTWNDRVSFVLTEGGSIKKIDMLDVVFEEHATRNHDDNFDADVAIFTGNFAMVINDLFDALGGEVEVTAK